MKSIRGLIIVAIIIFCSFCSSKKQLKVTEKCDISLKKCTTRMNCGLALHDYRISCKAELYGRTNDTCSELCQLAIISLANTAEGNEYLNCDCAENTYCSIIRNRTRACYPDEPVEVDNIKSCRMSVLYCKADPSCVEAWNYYKYLCDSAINGKNCTPRCNSSLAILMSRKIKVNVRECSCEDSGPAYERCRTEQDNIRLLCLSSAANIRSDLIVFCLTLISFHFLWPKIVCKWYRL